MTQPALSPYILALREKRGLTRGQKLRRAGLVTLTLLATGAFAPFWFGKVLAFGDLSGCSGVCLLARHLFGRGEANALQQLLEARLGAQAVKFGVYVEVDKPVRFFLDTAFLQPLQRLLLVA